MTVHLSDEEMIRQYLHSNSTNCFESLYNRYVQKVYKQCLSITKNAEQAQDFTHDIFIRIFSRLDSFQGRSTFSTWLYAISYNYCVEQIKRAKRLTTTCLTDEMDYHYTSTDDAEKSEYHLQQLSQVMSSIAPQEAMMLRLKYQEGLPVSQIGIQLNLKESAVKMRLKRSRNKVRQLCGAPMFQA